MSKTRYFCTLFDSSFSSRGISMILSLRRTHKDLKVVVFGFDSQACESVARLGLDFVSVVSLEELEDDELLSVKNSRSKAEYCWTCTASTILYCLEVLQLSHCTYVDADLYFYSDTSSVLDHLVQSKKSVLITPHFYTGKFDQSIVSGIFCVQYMLFRSTAGGMKVLKDWRAKCISWCYAKPEDGKFGDQKYLDSWPDDFGDEVLVSSDKGLGVAPWNVQQYDLLDQGQWALSDGEQNFEMKFYHFHALRSYSKQDFFYGWYPLPRWARRHLYPQYVAQLRSVAIELKKMGFGFNPHAKADRDFSYLKPLSYLKRAFYQLLLKN